VTIILPAGYVTILQAADILEQSLFAGLPDKPIVLRHRQAGIAVGDGDARDQAISEIWKAVDAGVLRVMAVGGRPRRLIRLDPDLTHQIPLLRSPRGRGFSSLRPSNPVFHDLAAWFGPNPGAVVLAFRETEIQRLARRLVRTRRRTTGSATTKARHGRPSSRAAVRAVIHELIEKRKWSSVLGLKSLAKTVNRKGKWPRAVSEDTVARALDELYIETQDRRFDRIHRKKRQ
jgi:hypothetical protein